MLPAVSQAWSVKAWYVSSMCWIPLIRAGWLALSCSTWRSGTNLYPCCGKKSEQKMDMHNFWCTSCFGMEFSIIFFVPALWGATSSDLRNGPGGLCGGSGAAGAIAVGSRSEGTHAAHGGPVLSFFRALAEVVTLTEANCRFFQANWLSWAAKKEPEIATNNATYNETEVLQPFNVPWQALGSGAWFRFTNFGIARWRIERCWVPRICGFHHWDARCTTVILLDPYKTIWYTGTPLEALGNQMKSESLEHPNTNFNVVWFVLANTFFSSVNLAVVGSSSQ